jgi:uncharacterized protein YjbI with pentapeptide repeats
MDLRLPKVRHGVIMQPPANRKRILVTASRAGIERAERRLALSFNSKSEFAKAQLMSKTTVDKFFNRRPIQRDSFVRICDELGIEDWRSIAELEPVVKQLMSVEGSELTEQSRSVETIATQTLISQGTPARRITVVDQQSGEIRIELILEGDITSTSATFSATLETILRTYSGNTIRIVEIQPGSIRVSIQGSSKDVAKLLDQLNSGKISHVAGFRVEDIQILSPEFLKDTKQISDAKWHLIQEIVSQPMHYRQLRGSDLSGGDLSDADLSDADLSDADLSDANLSGANLSGANLSGANLIDANLNRSNLSGSNLSGATLSGANLSDADLRDTDFSDADISNADLSGSNLSGSNLSEVMKLLQLINEQKQELIIREQIRQREEEARIAEHARQLLQVQGSKLNRLEASRSVEASVPPALVRVENNSRNRHIIIISRAFLGFVIGLLGSIGSLLILNTYAPSIDPKLALAEELVSKGGANKDLRFTDLSGANLSGADLKRSNLSGANLTNANLSRANLTNANLSGANLTGANVTDAQFGLGLGLSNAAKQDLKQRGAIFDEAPGDQSPTSSPSPTRR